MICGAGVSRSGSMRLGIGRLLVLAAAALAASRSLRRCSRWRSRSASISASRAAALPASLRLSRHSLNFSRASRQQALVKRTGCWPVSRISATR